jgi:energy-coupling factor transport system substrate-specific component
MANQLNQKVLAILEPVMLILTFVLLILTGYLGLDQSALLSVLIIVLSMIPFFLRFENSKPKPRDIVPIVVLSVIATAGRAIFGVLPNIQPVTAIVILSGIIFGPQAGFLTGSLTALTSSMFLGMGPWTPWQMVAWGVIGYMAGNFENIGFFRKSYVVYIYGFIVSVLYGWFMNIFFVIGYVDPINLQTVFAAYVASFVLDITHGFSTLIFLLLILNPWKKKLIRIKEKYGLIS